ncbi:hypothetical protein E2562_021816 [Oryza meyeriana var. granulata]|uniref:Rx N-terminal domain-containing protein n=1 Tax=Oryza meyeriana var. granulata TaxID=110450 RepID=A0A6G1EN98_9ORYZ|nr:hypothetical protein E2562_021816 [Oryza meyeriana var. granulata]
MCCTAAAVTGDGEGRRRGVAGKLCPGAREMRRQKHKHKHSPTHRYRLARALEAVNQIIHGLVNRNERKSSAEEHMERLEMAHIKLEAALETSYKWRITDPSLLRWQKKLKRAAQECDDTLHECQQRVLEEEETEQEISESVDILGIVIKCLQLFNPHFKSTAESVGNELTQLPSQDFSWVPYAESCHKKHWDNIHSITTQWFRPNPLCCKQHGQNNGCGSSNLGMPALQGVSLGPVIEVSLQCYAPIPGFREQGTIVKGKPSLKEFPHMKVDLVYTPHGSSEDLSPEIKSSVVEVRKASMNMQSTRRTIRGARKAKMSQQQAHKMQHRTNAISDFLNLWSAHAPVQLQGSILDWIQKEKEAELAPPLLRLKF